jgi:hypothetical protein
MMVEEHVSNDEMEDCSFYNTVDPNDSEDNSTEEDDDVDDREMVVMETLL